MYRLKNLGVAFTLQNQKQPAAFEAPHGVPQSAPIIVALRVEDTELVHGGERAPTDR